MAQTNPAEYAERQAKLHELAGRTEGLKEYILSLDIRRQGNREAAGRMRRDPPEEGKVWMTSGDIFVRMTSEKAMGMVEADSAATEKELEEARKELKDVAEAIQTLEGMGKSDAGLFKDLKPLNNKDTNWIQSGLD